MVDFFLIMYGTCEYWSELYDLWGERYLEMLPEHEPCGRAYSQQGNADYQIEQWKDGADVANLGG